MKIAIAGASGFVGKPLVNIFSKQHEVIALSRSVRNLDQNKSPQNISWRACDLFSLKDAEKALEGVDVAIYLVHSMRPSAHLSQGTFEDFDLIVADNFVKAAERSGVKQIIYLGGLLPDNQGPPSQHLKSRQEVEEVFKKSKVPSTILRAAVILGGEGSSFHIMTRLVERLPVMICPSWTKTLSQPVSLRDVCKSIEYVLGKEEFFNKTLDLGGDEVLSYRDMMLKLARIRGLERTCFPVPFLSPKISALWVCGITGAPKSLVSPLIDGLRFSLICRQGHRLIIPGWQSLTTDEALEEALHEYCKSEKPHAFKPSSLPMFEARSVQRLPMPKGWTAEDVAQAYIDFLPQLRPRLVKVEVHGPWIYFVNRFPYLRLLVLEYSQERSWQGRQLLYVRGGFLSKKDGRGRLEFREVLDGQACLAAIHNFRPRLPWYIYKFTQAVFHVWIMNRFGSYLKKMEKSGETPQHVAGVQSLSMDSKDA